MTDKPLNIKSQLKYRIGILGTDLHYENPISIFRSAREISKNLNLDFYYFSGEPYQVPYAFDKQANILYYLANPQTLDGLILISNIIGSFCSARTFRERCLEFDPLPLVSMGVPVKNIPSVIVDNQTGINEAVSHLIEEHHHTRIVYIHGRPEHFEAAERFKAFRETMKRYGLEHNEDLILQGNFEQHTGTDAVKELLDNKNKKPGKDFSAIVCANDYMAAGVILELQNRGIAVPEEIAVTGFDNVKFSECLLPSLSTVHYPFEALTRQTIDLLLMQIKGEKVPELITVKAPFIPSLSCGCPDSARENSGMPLVPENLKNLVINLDPEFRRKINNEILHSINPTLTLWKNALIRLRKENKWNLITSEDSLSEGFDWSAQMLGKIAFNTFTNANYQNIIYRIGSALSTTLNLKELLTILTTLLPEAQMNKFCLCLYEDPETSGEMLPPKSRLILAYDGKSALKLPADGLVFATKELLPGGIKAEILHNTWVILSLYFNEKQLGFLLLDGSSYFDNLYWNLRNRISGALMGVKLLEETRKSNELLKEANKQKTQFFINVAHETKTPLTLIKNYLSLSRKDHPDDKNLRIIEENIDLLLGNMLNFLDVEKLYKGDTMYNHQSPVDLSQSLGKKCEMFRGFAQKKNINLAFNIEEQVFIQIDPWALDRILNNLLDNGVKYIQKGGKIEITLRQRKGKAFLEIRDNGPGFPESAINHVFEPYFLLSRKKMSKQGMGVGLSIVKKIMDDAGAEIKLEKNKNKGVTFTLIFDSMTAGSEKAVIITGKSHPVSTIENSPLVERNISPKKPSLLIVDDNIQLLAFLQQALEKNYNVFLAGNVEEALFKLKYNLKIDLIISDIMMDDIDGFSFLSEISKIGSSDNIPFIFLSALSGVRERIKGLGLGAIDYIEKPFSLEELQTKIESILSLRQRQEKKDLIQIRKKINALLSTHTENRVELSMQNFESMCRKLGMSNRKLEITQLLLKGYLYKQIASKLNISMRTVEYHIARIYKILNVKNRYELISKFQ
ncbi:MAG: substrate-binding domain-containing protein [Spirochaetales bacterium]|nr:substrate-binding domain-containing protein [Spirochaetales bacterium]